MHKDLTFDRLPVNMILILNSNYGSGWVHDLVGRTGSGQIKVTHGLQCTLTLIEIQHSYGDRGHLKIIGNKSL